MRLIRLIKFNNSKLNKQKNCLGIDEYLCYNSNVSLMLYIIHYFNNVRLVRLGM